MAISENLVRIRKARGITQQELAELLGITTQAYGKYERGFAQPNATQAVAIANVLGVTVEQLVGRENGKDA